MFWEGDCAKEGYGSSMSLPQVPSPLPKFHPHAPSSTPTPGLYTSSVWLFLGVILYNQWIIVREALSRLV